ncbi:hypothetical protein [Moraxella osloensis]|nr:hypothetical protein [Moraxella osloensis]
MLIKDARTKRYPQKNFAKNAVETENIEAKNIEAKNIEAKNAVKL